MRDIEPSRLRAKKAVSFDRRDRGSLSVHPGSFHFVPFDLAEIEGIPELVKAAKRLRSDLRAGEQCRHELRRASRAHAQCSDRALVRLNTSSPIVLTKYVVRSMMADGGGRIVNISSIAASTGYSGLSVYAATKAALVGFTRSLAREVGRMGVNCERGGAGFVDTEMTKGLTDEQRRAD